MAKKDWKKFEEVVADLEQKLAGDNTVVKSPDILFDKDTSSPLPSCICRRSSLPI